MLENIIELAENKVPITLKSLKNTFKIISESNKYDTFVAFRGSITGGWIRVKYNEKKYAIFFISSKDMGKTIRRYEDEDEVIIVDIDQINDDSMTRRILYIDKEYC